MAIAKKRKKFFDIEIPLINKETQAQAFEIKELEGRFIKYDLTKILRGKSMEMSFKVVIEDGKATTIPRSSVIMPYFMKRAVRKGTNYVEDSFSTECANAQLRIKPFLVTRRKVSRAVRKALREKAKEFIVEYAKEKEYEEVFEEMLKGNLQKHMSQTLKKIYPLSFCEIRVLKVEKEIASKE